jgi:hypothetical protein
MRLRPLLSHCLGVRLSLLTVFSDALSPYAELESAAQASIVLLYSFVPAQECLCINNSVWF